jgi:hypothetical protein
MRAAHRSLYGVFCTRLRAFDGPADLLRHFDESPLAAS